MLKEHQGGATATGLCRKHGISDATFYPWRSKYGGMEVSDARKLKRREKENAKLKKLLAEQMLERHRPTISPGLVTLRWQKSAQVHP